MRSLGAVTCVSDAAAVTAMGAPFSRVGRLEPTETRSRREGDVRPARPRSSVAEEEAHPDLGAVRAALADREVGADVGDHSEPHAEAAGGALADAVPVVGDHDLEDAVLDVGGEVQLAVLAVVVGMADPVGDRLADGERDVADELARGAVGAGEGDDHVAQDGDRAGDGGHVTGQVRDPAHGHGGRRHEPQAWFGDRHPSSLLGSVSLAMSAAWPSLITTKYPS